MTNIKILEGDITKASVDAIVNAANPKMLGGGGVDGAIHRAAGSELLEACRRVKAVNGVRCNFGEARITSAGNLPSKFVIHTVGPIYKQAQNPKELLESAYYSSLILAKENECCSIAFPAISCGVYGYPAHEAVEVSLGVCARTEFKDLDIFFYLYSAEMYELWSKTLSQKYS